MARASSISTPVGPAGAVTKRSRHRVVIVGSGFAGIGAAIELLRSGESDFVVLERADDLGGTWRDNTYPGCRCDVQSNLYSFSFAPNPDWSDTFPAQGEIWEYLRGTARRFGVMPFLRFGHEMTDSTWDDAAQRWIVTTTAGTFEAQFLLLATGFLVEPKVPDITGIDSFSGAIMHSARWDSSHDLAGEHVAVIGTGASSIQIVPSIQPVVASVTVFQRTAGWVVPHTSRPVREAEQRLFRHLPIAQRASRMLVYWLRELLVLSFVKRPERMSRGERLALEHLESQVPDPEMRRKLTPGYKMGCKRILPSNDFYPALSADNAHLVTESITKITPDAIVTSDGVAHLADTIVLGTGFHVTDSPVLGLVHGNGGETLASSYASDTPGYLGTTFPGFPNLFLMTGPNTGLGHSSMVFMIECQLRYVIDSLKALRAHGAATFEVREEVAERYNAEVQARLSGTVWGSGCASWYLDATGRNTVIWPDFTFVYRRRTRHFDPAEYLLHGPRRQRTRSAGGPVTDSVRAELAATAGAAPART